MLCQILSHTCRRMEEKLQRCFNTVKFTWDDWKKLSKRMTPEDLKPVYDSLAEANPIPSAILISIRDVIDSSFQNHLGSLNVFAHLESSAWTTAWESYKFALPNALKETVDEIRHDGLTETLSPDVLLALDTCPAKVAVILNTSDIQDELEHYIYFPFMCRTVLEHLDQSLRVVQRAILEVCFQCFFVCQSDLYLPY